jgi:outer membrane immunogenic protein
VGERYSVTATGTGALLTTTGTQGIWGGTVGAGVEFSFYPDWSAAVEYDHLFLKDSLVTFNTPYNANVNQSVDLVTVRINYRWGGPVIAKY